MSRMCLRLLQVHCHDDLDFDEPDDSQPDLTTVGGLVQALELQAALLVDSATRLIDRLEVKALNAKYKQRRQTLVRALRRRGLEYPFPWGDLHEWHGHWSTIPDYAARRAYIRELVDPILEALRAEQSRLAVIDPRAGSAPVSWPDPDSRVAGLTAKLAGAASLDDLQDVGRRAREVLIDCGQLLADPALVPSGESAPKVADAKAWFQLFLTAHAGGSSREELRHLVRDAWELAQKVAHGKP